MSKQDMSNNAQHVYFLQKKKAEILAKKEREKVSQEENPTAAEVPVKKEPSIKLPFANDGSFLERFKLMQQQQQLKEKGGETSAVVKQEDQSTFPEISKRSPYNEPVSSKFQPSSEKSLKVSSTKTQPELAPPASIFKQEDEDVYQPSEYDLARALAEKVADHGNEIEVRERKDHQGDSRYMFLFDPSSPVAQYYQSELKQFKEKIRKRRWDDSDGAASSSTLADASQQPTSPNLSSSSSSSSAPIDPLAEFAKAKALIQAKAAALTSRAVPIPPPQISEEDKKRQRAIEEQKMMNEIYRKVIEQQAIFAAASIKRKRHDPEKPKYDYDSDEDTEGGTWEHKKRQKEMQKTEEWAGQLTDNARGKHHLSDFLPPEELEKFMENVKAVQEGRQADISDYAKFKIQADNVGFQLLQKAGWQEGTGLGKKKDGITQPINKGKTSFDQAGVGAEKPLEVKADDDDFELYRKRMMLAYKFRPNPMNNPRRPYY